MQRFKPAIMPLAQAVAGAAVAVGGEGEVGFRFDVGQDAAGSGRVEAKLCGQKLEDTPLHAQIRSMDSGAQGQEQGQKQNGKDKETEAGFMHEYVHLGSDSNTAETGLVQQIDGMSDMSSHGILNALLIPLTKEAHQQFVVLEGRLSQKGFHIQGGPGLVEGVVDDGQKLLHKGVMG